MERAIVSADEREIGPQSLWQEERESRNKCTEELGRTCLDTKSRKSLLKLQSCQQHLDRHGAHTGERYIESRSEWEQKEVLVCSSFRFLMTAE